MDKDQVAFEPTSLVIKKGDDWKGNAGGISWIKILA
jgi:hypothetical protein